MTYDKRSSTLLVLFTLPLLFLPKINLVKMGGESAGLRFDDLVLACLFGLIFLASLMLGKGLRSAEKILGGIVLASLVSFFFGKLLFSADIISFSPSPFYCVRIIEYFLFFYVGLMAAKILPAERVIHLFLAFNIVLIGMQKMQWIGAMTVEGYQPNVSYRTPGIASFPSEMGLLLNLLFCYVAFGTKKRWHVYLYFIILAPCILFTGNRISIAALAITFLGAVFRGRGNQLGKIILVMAIALPMLTSNELWQRSTKLFSVKNLEIVTMVWERTELNKSPLKGLQGTERYDMSWWIRLHKWCHASKWYVETPQCYLTGLGPGFCGPALDGGLLRILVENGLVGLILYAVLFLELGKASERMKWLVIAFGVNLVFFDAYLAYKPMSLLLFTYGCETSSPTLTERVSPERMYVSPV